MNFYEEQIEKQVLYDAFSATCEKRKTIFTKDDIDTLSRNLSIIKFRISVDALLLFPSEIFLTLSFNCLDELITLTPPRTSSLHLEFP